jgi:hypothetical protein
MTLHTERRSRRSSDPLVALHFQLAQSRNERGLEAIVVADDSGVVVAGAGGWAACEELAAYAPLLAQATWGVSGSEPSGRLAEIRARTNVRTICVDGQTVLLCASGGRPSSAELAELGEVADGVARILSRAA